MNSLEDRTVYDSYLQQGPFAQNLDYQSSGRLSLFVVFLLAPLIISAVAVSALPGFNYMVIGFGVGCGVSFLIASINSGLVFPPELKLFGLFILWSISGVFVARFPELTITKLRTLVQVFALFAILALFAANLKNVRFLLGCVFLGAMIVGMSAVMTGEFRRAQVEGERAVGFAMDANMFSVTLVYAQIIVLYFFRTWKSLFLKAGIFAFIFILGLLIIASGSRQGFIGYVLVMVLWFFLSYRKDIFRKPLATATVALIAVLALWFFFSRMSGTVMQERLQLMKTIRYGGEGGSISTRMTLMHDGVRIIASRPLFGIGLDNFRVTVAMGRPAHNNYIDVFAGAGVLGGLFYYGVYAVLGLRLYRLGKLNLELKVKEFLTSGKILLLLLLPLEMAAPTYYTKMNWILMAIFIGYTYQIQRRIGMDQSSANF